MQKRLTELWDWLTLPAKGLGPEARRRARLTATLSLTYMGILVLYLLKDLGELSFGEARVGPDGSKTSLAAEAAVLGVLILCGMVIYATSRTRRASLSALMLVGGIVAGAFISAFLIPDPNAFTQGSAYLATAVLVSTLLLSVRSTLVVAAVSIAAIAVQGYLLEPLGTQLADALFYQFISCALLLIGSEFRHRDYLQIKRERELSDRILDASPDYIGLKDQAHRYLRVNPALARALGKKPEEVLGRSDADLGLGFGDDFAGGDQLVLDGATTHHSSVHAVTLAAGDDIVLHAIKVPVRASGDERAVLGIGRDMTKLYRTERQLEAERMRAEQALAQREQLLGLVPAGLFEADADGRWTYVNERFAATCGLDAILCLGIGWIRSLHPDDREEFLSLWRATVGARIGLDAECRLLRPDGGVVWIHMKMSVLTVDSLVSYLGAVHDVSDARRRDEELRQNRNFLQSLIDNLPLGLFVRDAIDNFKYTVVNKQAERIFGIDAATMLGTSDHSPTAEVAARRQRDLDILASGQVIDVPEDVVPDRLGNPRILHVIKAPITTGDGTRRYLLGLVEDVTEKVEARRQIDLFHRVANEMSLGLCVFELKDRQDPRSFQIALVNRAAETFFGKEAAQLIGKGIMVTNDVPNAVELSRWQTYQRLALEGGTVDLGRMPLTRVAGADRIFRIRAFGLEGAMVGILLDDVTERVATEHALEAERLKLLESAKLASLGELSGGIAHEINNPLTVVQGKARIARLLLTEKSPIDGETIKRATALMEGIENGAGRIAKIIRGLRSFTRDGTKDPFVRESLAAIVGDTLALTKERALNHGIELRDGTRELADTALECRATQIVQILVNLLSNAHDAVEGRPGAWIEITAEATANNVRLSIANSGPPIPPDVQAKMWRPFFTTKPVGRGTGLGLSISLGLAQEHSGVLEYDQLSPHPRFVLTLPRIQESSWSRPPNATAS